MLYCSAQSRRLVIRVLRILPPFWNANEDSLQLRGRDICRSNTEVSERQELSIRNSQNLLI